MSVSRSVTGRADEHRIVEALIERDADFTYSHRCTDKYTNITVDLPITDTFTGTSRQCTVV